MAMTIDKAINRLENYYDTFCAYSDDGLCGAIYTAIDTMRKYQKITKILNSASYTENGTVYSYTYDENTRIKHIRKVLEDEEID